MTEVKENVIRMEDILGEKAKPDVSDPLKKVNKLEKHVEKLTIPKGKPKSGRVWKEQKTRFSSIIKTRGTRLSFEKKQKLRNDMKRIKELSRSVIARRHAEREAKKQRRIDNLKRAEENRKKSEIVQVIKNTSKIKKMKKKNLRKLEKRDTTNM
ncbi:coiled-coil domain-containing protein 86 [Neodiprion pinetum]|uniref:Coiled-coil domain-containing protein 86 n=1 Tax=Neodiprion lecontei TaxID=441921 RepID=A0A6J0C255_NEOLC|nr:coiled-coil domain-containing protein 86 [Neodiprion lecontei]XP_046472700.1 coiled-coil domain-containing protein 86 [Neodiprion pinetum]